MIPAGQVSQAFLAVVEVAIAQGAQRIDRLPGCWEGVIDEHWTVAVNGHGAPMHNSRGDEVPSWGAVVYHDDTPVGVLALRGGTMLQGAEDDLIAACDAAKLRLLELPA